MSVEQEQKGRIERLESVYKKVTAEGAAERVGASVALLAPHLVSKMRLRDTTRGIVVEIIGDDGLPKTTAKPGSIELMDAAEYAASLRNDPVFGIAFDTAAPAPGGQATRAPGGGIKLSQDELSKLSPTEQIKAAFRQAELEKLTPAERLKAVHRQQPGQMKAAGRI